MGKATANSPNYDYIAKEKLDAIIKECDDNTEWLTDLDKRQSALQKWETPLFSIAELGFRASSLSKNSTKVFSELRPKPKEEPKAENNTEKEQDGKGSTG